MNLYVGTYHKYNCGSLEGEWVNLDLFPSKEEFLVACYDLHKDADSAFVCSSYRGMYKDCVMHFIKASTVKTLVLTAVQKVSSFVLKDAKQLLTNTY